jgi:hypothetical protein
MIKRIRTKTKPDLKAVRGIMTRINAQGWLDLKLTALEQETTLNALAVEAFNDLLKKYGKRPTVENPLLDR